MAYSRCPDHAGSALVVIGGPGIGKTSLLESDSEHVETLAKLGRQSEADSLIAARAIVDPALRVT